MYIASGQIKLFEKLGGEEFCEARNFVVAKFLDYFCILKKIRDFSYTFYICSSSMHTGVCGVRTHLQEFLYKPNCLK
jgi:hypothetical protein